MEGRTGGGAARGAPGRPAARRDAGGELAVRADRVEAVGPGVAVQIDDRQRPGLGEHVEFSADLLVNDPNLSIRDGASGAVIEQVATNAPSTMPAWSPDGTTISYISKVHDPFGDIDFFEGDLVIHRNFRDVGSTSQVLVAADGAANTYPSFSPDGQTIAFSRGPFSRSHTQWNQDDTAGLSPGDLFLVRADGRDPAVKLAAASRDQEDERHGLARADGVQ